MVRITTADLTAVDPDDAASDLVFAISNVSGGMITHSGAPGLSVDTFTQADLLAGRVHFAHDGGESPSAALDVVVTDHEGASSGKPQSVKVGVKA